MRTVLRVTVVLNMALKEGKERMQSIGRVEVPPEVFVSALKLDD